LSAPNGSGAAGGVEGLRAGIEDVDREILERVARRVELARRIGAMKKGAAAATLDPEREAAVIRRAVETARELGLPAEPVRELFWTLVGMCRMAQLEER
jgi:chorismate mutase